MLSKRRQSKKKIHFCKLQNPRWSDSGSLLPARGKSVPKALAISQHWSNERKAGCLAALCSVAQP